MKVELLKNKQTSIIEKIIINKGMSHLLSDIPFNLTHKQTMIELDEFDLGWHELIMDYSSRTNPINIRAKLYKDFNNREIDYLITILDTVHKTKFGINQEYQSIDSWFFNYYMWSIFYLLTRDKKKANKYKTKLRVVDPTILLFVDGIKTLGKYEVFHNYEKAKELFNAVWYHDFNKSFEQLHIIFSKHRYSNEKVNLEIFKKEVMKLSEIQEPNWIFWNAKKLIISELLIDLIKEKIHYSA